MQKYRVFFNNGILQAINFSQESFDFNADERDYSQSELARYVATIHKWLTNEIQCVTVDVKDSGAFAAAIRQVFRSAPAAGGLIVYDGKIVAIKRNGIPDLPKGHIEVGESPETAALREVTEETGIANLKIVRELPSTWHCYLLNGKWTIKKTSWYQMTTSEEIRPVPQQEEGISEIFFIDKLNFNDFIEKTFTSIREVLGTEIKEIVYG